MESPLTLDHCEIEDSLLALHRECFFSSSAKTEFAQVIEFRRWESKRRESLSFLKKLEGGREERGSIRWWEETREGVSFYIIWD